MNDDELERLAREEILRETQRASVRAEQVGPQGWKRCPVLPANKRFLRNMIVGALPRSQPPKRTRDEDHHRTNSRQSFSEKRSERDETRIERPTEPPKRRHKVPSSVRSEPSHIDKHSGSVLNDRSCATDDHDKRPAKKKVRS